MTWRSAICFSALVAWTGAGEAGVVTANVRLVNSREAAVRRQADYSGVVLWLEPAGRALAPAPALAAMVLKDTTFRPHVLVVGTASPVEFPNLDPIFHNAFSNFNGQVFDIGLYPPGKSRSIQFRRPGVVRVFCNIHPAMSAVIVVVDTPYAGVSDAGGRIRIAGVEAGTYHLRVFHERATPETLDALGRTVEAGAGETALGQLTISESGYLPLPHKNKYGRNYPPEAARPEGAPY